MSSSKISGFYYIYMIVFQVPKLLIIPLLFVCFMSVGQTINPASIIGKSVRIGHLEVAQFDFPDSMTWDDAVNACAALGKGCRLPTKNELNVLYQNKGKIGGFASASDSPSTYWSSTEFYTSSDDGEIAWCQVFYSGSQNYAPKFFQQSVRAVRTF